MENPYDFSIPANARTFKGRALEMQELLDSIDCGTHTVIVGLQRTGKTSLIGQGLAAKIETRRGLRDRIVVANIDMQRLGGAFTCKDLVTAIIDAVGTQIEELGRAHHGQIVRQLTSGIFAQHQHHENDWSDIFTAFTKVLMELADQSGRRIVLFLDEFSEIRKVIERNQAALNDNPVRQAGQPVHDRCIDVPFLHHLDSLLMDEALKQKVTFILVVRPYFVDYAQQRRVHLFKLLKPISLDRLDEAAARELITEPLESDLFYADGVVDYLVNLTAGHPYLLQFILKMVVDRIQRRGRSTIELDDVQRVEEQMVSDGPRFDAQFAMLTSDYGVDEVSHQSEASLGKGVLAVISRIGQPREGWATVDEIMNELAHYDVSEEKATSLLSQLTRARILDETCLEDQLQYRLSVPLIRARFVSR